MFIIFFFISPVTATAKKLSFKEQVASIDLLGTAVFLPGIVCVLLALQWGGSTYAWSNWRVILLFVLFAVLMVIFIGIQWWKQDSGTVPPRVLANRTVWTSAVFAACLGAAFFSAVYYVPVWFQAIQGVSATESGVRNLPLILSVVLMSLVAGILTTVIGYYTQFFYIAPVFAALGAGLMSTWTVESGIGMWIGYQVLFGFGIGFGLQQAMIAVQAALTLKDVPVGTAIVMFAQTFGGALFISVAQNIFSNKLLANVASYAPGVPPELVLAVGATDIKRVIGDQYPTMLDAVLRAYNDTITHGVFYVCCGTGAAAIITGLWVPWISVKNKKLDVAGGA